MPRLLAVCAVADPGGAELAVVRLLRELAPRGWEPALASPAGALHELAAAEGWPVEALDPGGLARGAGARAVASWPKARRLARGADAVLVNGTVAARLLPALAGGPLAGPGRRSGRARTALYVHDVVDRVPPHWRLADVVLTASGAVAAPLARLDPQVVYAPVAPDPPPAEPPWQPDGRPVVGFVGRIERRKGPLDLARAAPGLTPRARVVIVGDDPYGSDPRYLAEVKAATGVEHYGWAENGPGLMRHLDVLVLPATREPFGTVLSEAMAVGTPVVATSVDGLPEVVTDGVDGALVAPGDPEALAAAILRVLDNRDAYGAAARVSAQRFAAAKVADRVEALLRGAGQAGA